MSVCVAFSAGPQGLAGRKKQRVPFALFLQVWFEHLCQPGSAQGRKRALETETRNQQLLLCWFYGFGTSCVLQVVGLMWPFSWAEPQLKSVGLS